MKCETPIIHLQPTDSAILQPHYYWQAGLSSLRRRQSAVPRRQPHRRSGLTTLPSVGAIP